VSKLVPHCSALGLACVKRNGARAAIERMCSSESPK
jgi:hypothetical protein